MKLKNALFLLVLMGLAAYGGVKGYIYFKVKDQLDNLVLMAAPFANISYAGISSSLAGEVGVEGLRVAPPSSPLSIRIDSISLRGDGIGFLFDLLGGMRMDQPPQQLNLTFRGVQIPLGSDLVDQISPELAAVIPASCSLGGILQNSGLSDAGYQQLRADAHLGYRLNQRAGELTLRFGYTLDGIENALFEAELQNVSNPGAVVMGMMPTLRRMSMSYQLEAGYIDKMVGYCAREAGMNQAQFIDRLFSQDADYYANNLGFIPGDGIRMALRELLTQSGELLLMATPATPVNPNTLAVYSPQELVAMLNMGVSINGKPVNDLSFEVADFKRLLSRLSGESDDASSPALTANSREKRAAQPKAVYLNTPLVELKRYIGRDVRLFTKGGKIERKPQQGILMAMKDQVLDIEQRLHGGKMTVHIPLELIERIEVLRRP